MATILPEPSVDHNEWRRIPMPVSRPGERTLGRRSSVAAAQGHNYNMENDWLSVKDGELKRIYATDGLYSPDVGIFLFTRRGEPCFIRETSLNLTALFPIDEGMAGGPVAFARRRNRERTTWQCVEF